MRVDLERGKYTVVMEQDGRLHALRYGEEWRDLVGDKLVLALAQEVELLRSVIIGFVADDIDKDVELLSELAMNRYNAMIDALNGVRRQ